MARKWSANRLWGLLALCAFLFALPLAPTPARGLSEAVALPPRPTVNPTPTTRPFRPPLPTPAPRPVIDPSPAGAEIELRTDRPGVWSVVQWQDTAGRWHDVEGWRGTTDLEAGGLGIKVWWLSESLFGQGPFRWALLSAPGGDTTAASAPFYLPQELGDKFTITIP